MHLLLFDETFEEWDSSFKRYVRGKLVCVLQRITRKKAFDDMRKANEDLREYCNTYEREIARKKGEIPNL